MALGGTGMEAPPSSLQLQRSTADELSRAGGRRIRYPSTTRGFTAPPSSFDDATPSPLTTTPSPLTGAAPRRASRSSTMATTSPPRQSGRRTVGEPVGAVPGADA